LFPVETLRGFAVCEEVALRYIGLNSSKKQALSLQQGRRQDAHPSMLFSTFSVYIKLGRAYV